MKKTFIFVEYRTGVSKESQRPYQILTLSDGLRSAQFPNPKGLDFTQYNEGDRLLLELDLKINYRGGIDVIPTVVAKQVETK